MKKKEVLRRTGPCTQEERATYYLQYRFDLGNRYVYADQQAVDGFGCLFYEKKDGTAQSGCNAHITPELEQLMAEGRVEEGSFTKIIEYEADYS